MGIVSVELNPEPSEFCVNGILRAIPEDIHDSAAFLYATAALGLEGAGVPDVSIPAILGR